MERIPVWLRSENPYTIRFGMEMLMVHYLREDYQPEYLSWVSEVDSNNYYVNMMSAWFYATALAEQYEDAKVFLEERRIPAWIHNKTIQKAVESFRITDEQKAELRALRRCE